LCAAISGIALDLRVALSKSCASAPAEHERVVKRVRRRGVHAPSATLRQSAVQSSIGDDAGASAPDFLYRACCGGLADCPFVSS